MEQRTVEVDIELDGCETVRHRIHRATEGTERVGPLAHLPWIADVAILGVLGLTDPLTGRREVVPAARRRAGQGGTGHPVLLAALELAGEALLAGVALLDHRAVRVLASPPGQQR